VYIDGKIRKIVQNGQETYEIKENAEFIDNITYGIRISRSSEIPYEKPTEVTWMENPKKSGNKLYGFKNKSLSAKICEYSLNAGWRFLHYNGWLVDEQEWKIGSAMEEDALDTYYDVDWSSLTTVAYLNMVGAVT